MKASDSLKSYDEAKEKLCKSNQKRKQKVCVSLDN